MIELVITYWMPIAFTLAAVGGLLMAVGSVTKQEVIEAIGGLCFALFVLMFVMAALRVLWTEEMFRTVLQ